jgi:hypothetical protein
MAVAVGRHLDQLPLDQLFPAAFFENAGGDHGVHILHAEPMRF